MTALRGGHPASSGALAWRVFLTCWIVYTVFWSPYIVREHFPAVALAERGSMNVEQYFGWTGDIFHGSQGGAYINNNPGASLTGAVPLLLMRPLLRRLDAWNQQLPRSESKNDEGEVFLRTQAEGRALYFLFVGFVTVALVMAPATAGTAAYLCSRLMEANVPPASAAVAAILYGLGTPVLFRAGYLNHNLLVGDAGITALLLLWDPKDRPLHPARAAVAGLLSGYAVLCDYSGVVVVLVMALYAWLRSTGQPTPQRLRAMSAFAGGVAPAVAGLAIYQAWAFGSFYRPSQHYMPATAMTSQGYRGFDWPSLALVWTNFFSPQFGLFAYCPALLLAFAAPFTSRVPYRIPQRETRILWTYFALFVLFCAANQYSWLQLSTGFRYLVPVVPILALLAMQAAQALPAVVRWGIATVSCVQSFIIAAAYRTDIRLAAGTLWKRRFKLPWMIRLGYTGVPVTWAWPVITYISLVLVVAFVWLVPWSRKDYRHSDSNAYCDGA